MATNITPGSADLSSGAIDPLRQGIFAQELKEEAERLRWKTRILWGQAIGVILFYGIFLCYVFHERTCYGCQDKSTLVIGILAAIPSLLALSLVRIVARKPSADDDEEILKSPWYTLGKELVEIVREFLKQKGG